MKEYKFEVIVTTDSPINEDELKECINLGTGDLLEVRLDEVIDDSPDRTLHFPLHTGSLYYDLTRGDVVRLKEQLYRAGGGGKITAVMVSFHKAETYLLKVGELGMATAEEVRQYLNN